MTFEHLNLWVLLDTLLEHLKAEDELEPFERDDYVGFLVKGDVWVISRSKLEASELPSSLQDLPLKDQYASAVALLTIKEGMSTPAGRQKIAKALKSSAIPRRPSVWQILSLE